MSRRFGIPLERWLDLSTGLNPWSCPISPLDAAACRGLPDDDEALLEAARGHYLSGALAEDQDRSSGDVQGALDILPIPGSQWAIERLPQLLPRGSVALPHIGYREHAWQWQQAGHRPWYYDPDRLQETLTAPASRDDLRALVVVNPNNPGGQHHSPQLLAALAQTLKAQGALLIVDEAFVDATPESSLLPDLADNVLVLRSLGKFFGLAGLRLGFVIGRAGAGTPLARLSRAAGRWMISAPAQQGGREALRHGDWQVSMRQRLAVAAAEQGQWLAERLGVDVQRHRSCALFNAFDMRADRARLWHQGLAHEAISTRLWPVNEEQAILRIGLHDEGDTAWRHLERAFDHANILSTSHPS